MIRYRELFFVGLVIYHAANAFAQENQEEASGEGRFRKHSISASLAHVHVKQGIEDGTRDWLTVPAFMVDYNYRFSEKWSAGVHSDFLLESFEIERFEADGTEDIIIEREHPVVVVGAIGYKPVHFLTIVAGGGVEFEKEKNFGVFRIGLEPGIEISEKWEMNFSLTYDVKIKGYDTWNLGVGMARLF
jgi:hypothetical protein